MTSQWSALANQRALFHTRYFCNTYEKFHGTFHTCMNSYVEDFIRVSNQTRLKKIRVCKIPWMILHNDTRIKSYTYEKSHVWKVTRLKNYTYEKLHVLNIEFWLVHCYTRIDSFTELLIVLRFIHVTFYTCNLWRILSTSANHTQMASNAESVSIWWRHHDMAWPSSITTVWVVDQPDTQAMFGVV